MMECTTQTKKSFNLVASIERTNVDSCLIPV
jgi:hypothetical protein